MAKTKGRQRACAKRYIPRGWVLPHGYTMVRGRKRNAKCGRRKGGTKRRSRGAAANQVLAHAARTGGTVWVSEGAMPGPYHIEAVQRRRKRKRKR